MDYVICADGRKHVIILPDGSYVREIDPIKRLLMHLEVLGMELGDEFTVDDNKGKVQ